jgi:hypothetical protein
MTTLAVANDEATRLAADALDGLGLTPDALSDDAIAAILAVVIPHIRADERERCLDAARSLQPPATALYSSVYRSGHEAARTEIVGRIEQLPLVVALD